MDGEEAPPAPTTVDGGEGTESLSLERVPYEADLEPEHGPQSCIHEQH